MFSVVEHKFNVAEYMFNVAEHKFNDAEHRFRRGPDKTKIGDAPEICASPNYYTLATVTQKTSPTIYYFCLNKYLAKP